MTATLPAIVSLNLPFPPRELSPNARVYRKARAAVVAGYREQCRMVAHSVRTDMQQKGMTFPLQAPATAVITFVLVTRQRRDLDNLLASFKNGIDALVLAGLLSDDDCWSLRIGMEVETGKAQCVRVRLEGAIAGGGK